MRNAMSHLSTAAAIVLATGCCVSSAQAAACRDTQIVQQSADLSRNSQDGGHVAQHVFGMTPPQGFPQNGKTLFADAEKAKAAWRQYQYIDNPKACAGAKDVIQDVSLQKLGIKSLDAYECTAANAQGECTAKTMYVANSVEFAFGLNGDHKWVLKTMFPVALK